MQQVIVGFLITLALAIIATILAKYVNKAKEDGNRTKKTIALISLSVIAVFSTFALIQNFTQFDIPAWLANNLGIVRSEIKKTANEMLVVTDDYLDNKIEKTNAYKEMNRLCGRLEDNNENETDAEYGIRYHANAITSALRDVYNCDNKIFSERNELAKAFKQSERDRESVPKPNLPDNIIEIAEKVLGYYDECINIYENKDGRIFGKPSRREDYYAILEIRSPTEIVNTLDGFITELGEPTAHTTVMLFLEITDRHKSIVSIVERFNASSGFEDRKKDDFDSLFSSLKTNRNSLSKDIEKAKQAQ